MNVLPKQQAEEGPTNNTERILFYLGYIFVIARRQALAWHDTQS